MDSALRHVHIILNKKIYINMCFYSYTNTIYSILRTKTFILLFSRIKFYETITLNLKLTIKFQIYRLQLCIFNRPEGTHTCLYKLFV